MWLIDTFDDFEQYLQLFKEAIIVGEHNGLVFKKVNKQMSVCYGLFEGEELVAYFWLVRFKSQYKQIVHGFELRVRESHRGKGLAMFLYMQAVIVDRHWIMSDYSHSPTMNIFWNKFRNNPKLKVLMYNRMDDAIEWHNTIVEEKVYGNDTMHFVVMPTLTIQDLSEDQAELVNGEVVVNTCIALSNYSTSNNGETHYKVKPLSFEI